ncbi:MAG: AI-2E family transporter [Deltaproteobacteria bacterium]|nr:AI-2E family transporter [Deltaproteobacteria bacterium]MBW2136227.1 AI-2E family transporter [Deltaproteobacteria bacterium]
MKVFSDWFRRHFSDPQVVILAVLLTLGTIVVLILGNMLAPVLASMVIAYLLEGLVGLLQRHRIPRLLAVLLVFIGFMSFLFFLILGMLPLLWKQVVQLFQTLPSMISWTQSELMRLPERYPDFISEQQVLEIINVLRSEITIFGQRILTASVASVRSIFSFLVYTVLMPLLVFFFLKDKTRLLQWLTRFLPADRSLAAEVWRQVDQQIGNYIRGKFWEILIVWAASYVTLQILGLQFAVLISLFVGLSVLIPYFGAIIMTFPVASIAYFQWGWSSHFAYVVIAYVIIQILDGNLLVALLYSEVVNLHPVAIIVAVLVFGGIWGFWGVFFAIPLATLVHAVIQAWAQHRSKKTIQAPLEEAGAESQA